MIATIVWCPMCQCARATTDTVEVRDTLGVFTKCGTPTCTAEAETALAWEMVATWDATLPAIPELGHEYRVQIGGWK